ncbi:MAG TPA: histidine phosphatase family protein [Solirubrobacteraceae bacterium]|nr:histidine phosphatase family protein [Solirubrobacteraceae bacterium]
MSQAQPEQAPPAQAQVYLARHGQTAYNHEGRFQGQQQVPLDDTGRAQAAQLAQRATAYGFRALWCSPLLRARETADVVAARLGLEPKDDARLMETDAGDWTNLTFEEVRAQAPERFDAFAAAEPGFSFPGGESFAEQEVRVSAALADIEKGELPALVVCHGMVIRAAFASRAGDGATGPSPTVPFKRVPNAALVPLAPAAAARAAAGDELGGGAPTLTS